MWKTAHVQAPAMVIHLIFGHPIRRARQHGLGRLALLDFTVLDA